jgi:hypothetical protein
LTVIFKSGLSFVLGSRSRPLINLNSSIFNFFYQYLRVSTWLHFAWRMAEGTFQIRILFQLIYERSENTILGSHMVLLLKSWIPNWRLWVVFDWREIWVFVTTLWGVVPNPQLLLQFWITSLLYNCLMVVTSTHNVRQSLFTRLRQTVLKVNRVRSMNIRSGFRCPHIPPWNLSMSAIFDRLRIINPYFLCSGTSSFFKSATFSRCLGRLEICHLDYTLPRLMMAPV